LTRPTSSVRFAAPGSVTAGQYGLFNWEMQPHAGGPSAHFHRTFSESFYVLDGMIRFFSGEATPKEWTEPYARHDQFMV